MDASSDAARAFLDRAYDDLDYVAGNLFHAADGPEDVTTDGVEWRLLGDWLMLADRMGADRLFFVGDDPVIVFLALPDDSTEVDVIRAYRRAWCLARPRCLFVALPGELRVYGLSSPPPRNLDDWQAHRPMHVVERVARVSEELRELHRARIESGQAFESDELSVRVGRADRTLLRDIRIVADALVSAGLTYSVAHALIERVILVRYLEDREVLTSDYLAEVANERAAWRRALFADDPTPNLGAKSMFLNCLGNARFTYAVFSRLEDEFNGDLFIVSEEEKGIVRQEHLTLIRKLLTGHVDPAQEPLFLWAYDFSIVPTSLISNMYEQFYHAGHEPGKDAAGTHYTPIELVEFVLAESLTPDVLDRNPRICDLACGSGVFLVEAYRWMVRTASANRGSRLSSQELRDLLLTRIAGIDTNSEAIRLAAFSLYLALLNYQSPQDIRIAGPLPPPHTHARKYYARRPGNLRRLRAHDYGIGAGQPRNSEQRGRVALAQRTL
jgi:hypothetical protein